MITTVNVTARCKYWLREAANKQTKHIYKLETRNCFSQLARLYREEQGIQRVKGNQKAK